MLICVGGCFEAMGPLGNFSLISVCACIYHTCTIISQCLYFLAKIYVVKSPENIGPSAVDSGGAYPEFEGSEKGRSLISAYQSLAITTNTPGFKKLSTALLYVDSVVISHTVKSFLLRANM